MKIAKIETMACDAGWRNYHFLKLTGEDGTEGWSEYDESFGSPGVSAVIDQLGRRLVGCSAFAHERFFAEASCLTRPAPGSVIAQAIGAMENAMLDLKARVLGVPCYELLGGKLRDKVKVYWSHCPSSRINHGRFFGPPVSDFNGVREAALEARNRGFFAIKTNLFIHDDGPAHAWRAGFGIPFEPELVLTPRLISNFVRHLEALREGAGPDVEILIDVNFNARPESQLKLIRALNDFDLYWIEIDSFNAEALATVRQASRNPIASCETLFGVRGFMPFFRNQSMDVAIVDATWNGAWQSIKIAAAADAFDVNIAPHNFLGDLCTFMALHVAAAVPNVHVMEVDVDRLSWESELLSHSPQYEGSYLVVPDTPGWGTTPNEAAIRARPPKVLGGLLSYKRD